MASQDDPRDSPQDDRRDSPQDDPRFGPSTWPPILQFIWAFLVDWRRVRTAVFLVVVIVLALLALKGAYAGVVYDLGQHVPHWVATSVLAGGVGGSILASVRGFRGLRGFRKARRTAKLPEQRTTAQPVVKPPGEEHDHGLSEPGED
jgi:hypothetical protein